MKKIPIGIVCLTVSLMLHAQTIKYSTLWFGPNANPVPEMTDARIPASTTVSVMADYYSGFGTYGLGDQTSNGYIKLEVPLLPERVSLKLWSTFLEHYNTTESIQNLRGALNTSGFEGGDIYVQTRIRLTNEQKWLPSIVLNSTLKTASAKTVKTRRYFDTPGYYFDLEAGKSFYTKSQFINEIRLVGNLGFMCWETTNSTQDDATMLAAKLILGNNVWKLENMLSGYSGWMHSNRYFSPDYGDAPMVYAAKFSYKPKNISYFAQYQAGINDFPYQQIRVGLSFTINKLTPAP